MLFPEAVSSLLRELAAIPYENLSKAVAFQRGRNLESALDFSSTWLEDHRHQGLGGTCFALTHWLKLKMDGLGYSTAYLMADKRQARNVHCGLLFEQGGTAFLLDPGYLIFEPLPLPKAGLSAVAFSSPNEIKVEDGEGVWRLHTGQAGALKHRFDFRKESVPLIEFQKYWEESYQWPMMRYPVLNRVAGGVQYYLQKNNLLTRTVAGGEMRRLSPSELAEAARSVFGLPGELVDEALGLMGFGR